MSRAKLKTPAPGTTGLLRFAVPVSTVASAADDEDMGASVVRWRRYGKDRLYVNGPAGERYGWGDVETGVVDVADEQYRHVVESLLRQHPVWRHGVPSEESAAHVASEVDVAAAAHGTRHLAAGSGASSEEPARRWVDLALNSPGDAARARAVELRQAAPIRTGLARIFGVHTDERAWRIGADGEESVARELSKLGEEWRSLHAVPVGRQGSDIDHVLIGPGGVFTINAKHHPGARVWVGGDTIIVGRSRVPYVRNARFEASRGSKLLSSAVGRRVRVTGIVALICKEVTIKTEPADVLVIGRRSLRQWLGRLGSTLDPEQTEVIYEYARRSTTWLS